jgi:redox-sensing transcriptional repressor
VRQEGNRPVQLKRVVLERLMRYYRFLSQVTAHKPMHTITSAQIAEALDIDPTQVRKDFGAIGLVGIGRVGYPVEDVCCAIRSVMGFNNKNRAILVGVGQLGGALLTYPGFEKYGLVIEAVFDSDPVKVGRRKAGHTIRSIRTMKPYIKKHGIRLAILCTPVEVSQTVTDRLVSVGIEAVWNFTPTSLNVPPGVLVRNEHISLGLSEIAYHLK